ncbi:DUF3224 domain-containing protein [Kitasatospora sp. NBC_01266]|uniref:DUF3224 domain-containing protein n=1 Tax=Kitasatospora sp. NBC_01266 TaxID=2903572 RepID=UPI002E31054A|nr:DUF3224 domain-containing protein [Kitasatospora sp. NBC_01266]
MNSTSEAISTSGWFTSANWAESPIGPGDPATTPRLARAAVSNNFTGGLTAAGTVCEYTLSYVTERTGVLNGLELITGSLDGRRGSFVIEQRGSFDEDGSVHCSFEVVAGSGTGALTGLRGSGSFRSRQGESAVPYVFGYDGLDQHEN